MPATAARCEPGASERAQQAPSTLPVVLAWHVGAAAAAAGGGGTEHRSLCRSRYSREVLLGGVSGTGTRARHWPDRRWSATMVCTPSSAAADRTMGGRRRREATPAKQRCLRMTRGLLRKALASFTVHPPSPGAWSSVRREPVSEAGKRASSPSIQRALVALAWNTAAAGSCTEHRSICLRAEPAARVVW